MSSIQLYDSPGINAVGVVDFNGTGEAGSKVTIGGVDYTEADTEDFASGVWTNGASAADGATSLAGAINGDERASAPAVTAVVSEEGNSVVLMYDYAGTDGNLAVSTDSASNITVEDMHDGEDPVRKHMATAYYTVTDQDVLANECDIPMPFAPNGFVAQVYNSSGAIKTIDSVFTIETGPDRIRVEFSGSTDPVAGDVIGIVAYE